DLHLLSREDGIWRIYNHRFIALETRNNLNLIAEIATRRYRCEQHAAAFYNCDLQTLRAKYKSADWHEVRGGLSTYLEMDRDIGVTCSDDSIERTIDLLE